MAAQPVPEESIPEIGRALVDDLRRVVQLEIQLVREQALSAVKSAIVDIALFMLAGVFVLIGVTYALLAISWKIGILDKWWGWALSGGVLLLLAALLAFIGARRLMRTIRQTKSTFDDIKGDAEWLKQLPQRAKSSS